MPTLQEQLQEIEGKVGAFSYYKTSSGPAEGIAFANKPAQQLCAALGCSADEAAALTKAPVGGLQAKDITLAGGFSKGLQISKARLEQLQKSTKVYVSEDLGWNAETYKNYIGQPPKPQDQGQHTAGAYWQNMAVGVCHVQEIDLLVSHQTDDVGEALTIPKTNAVDETKPPILLLSSPALNFNYGTGKELTPEQTTAHIKAMYRNIFRATVDNGRTHIAMPAAGLGVFGGDPSTYFSALMEVAKEFPNLNIIYHPGASTNNEPFQHAVKAAGNPLNVVQATKDVVFIADELCKVGVKCALHNPSDADVVYGVYDIGEYWKNGTEARYVGEEDIGSKTTAVLGSKGLNPGAYQNPILTKKGKLVHGADETPKAAKKEEVKEKSVPDKAGAVHPLRVDWQDEKGNTVSAADQAKQILDAALQLQKQGAKKIGITYSANDDEANGLFTNPDYNSFGTNQGAVATEIQKLLQTDSYKSLHRVFSIIPLSTMKKDGSAAADPTVVVQCKKHATNFVEKEQGVLLAWQNQTSNDGNKEHPYAIDGGIAVNVPGSQAVAADYQKFVGSLRQKHPSTYTLGAATSEPGDNTTPDQKAKAFADAAQTVAEKLKEAWKGDNVIDITIKENKNNKTTYEIKVPDPDDAKKTKTITASIIQSTKPNGELEFRCDAKPKELSLEKQYEMIARQSYQARIERAKSDSSISPSRVEITDIGGPGKGPVSGFKDAKGQEVLLTPKEKMVLAAYFKADPNAEITYKGKVFSDGQQFTEELGGKVTEKKPGWRAAGDAKKGGPAATGTESTLHKPEPVDGAPKP